MQIWIPAVQLGVGASPQLLVRATGAFAAAWCAGFVLLVAPAGAGVREAALVLLLGGVMARPEATGHPIRGLAAARLLSVGLSALGLVVLAWTVLQLVPGRPQLAVAATGLTALLPSFSNVSAVVYNDSLAFLTSTCALAASVVLVIRGPSTSRTPVSGGAWARLTMSTPARRPHDPGHSLDKRARHPSVRA